ncbi:MAG: (Fe-S)-binding protein [Xanthobacteraceae bacterium]
MDAFTTPMLTMGGDGAETSPPPLAPDAMRQCRPFAAQPAHNEPLGFPGALVEDWQGRAIDKMGELLERYRSLRVFLDICVKCGACTDKCHYFLGTGDPRNMPVARQDLLRSVYRHYFTPAGRMLGRLAGARALDAETLDEWFVYFHQCSQCRRCSVFCPYGIDTAEITMAAREIMDAIGMGQKYSNEIIGKVEKVGNNLGLTKPALANTLEGLEEDILDDTGVAVKFPLDVKGADVLLVTPSADFFAEPHVDGLIGYAKVFHQAGISWTLSSYASEAASLRCSSAPTSRCTTSRAASVRRRDRSRGQASGVRRMRPRLARRLFLPQHFGRSVGLSRPALSVPQHIAAVTHDLIETGGIRLDKEANAGTTVTLHDSCNVARASSIGDRPGGQFTIPRDIIRACVPSFVDMHPDTIGDKTFCCGGGGGLLTDELLELR